MLIESEFEPNGDLGLTAYTFETTERRALETVLERSGVQPMGSTAPPDAAGRPAQRYTVPSNRISRFSASVGGSFSPDGQFQPTGGGRENFACERIAGLTGMGGGCQTIQADDIAAARVACAMLARARQWFGGIPRRGHCP